MRRTRANRAPAERAGVGLPIIEFAATGLLALVIVGVGGALVLRHQGREESLRDARGFARLVARGMVEPNLRDGLLSGDRRATAQIDRVVRRRILGGQVVRVKIWAPPGRIVYSDEPRLIGSTFEMEPEELDALRTWRPATEISDLSRPENRYERRQGRLVEVYYPVTTPGGKPLLFETYIRSHAIAMSARKISLNFLPVLAAALLALWLVQLPLAWSLARRVRRGQNDRADLLRRAVESSVDERRRIASDLHDGVVQDLAGVALGLGASATRLPAETEPDVQHAITAAADGSRHALRRLRSLVVEIHPPNLRSVGLASALADLAAPLAASDIKVELDVPPEIDLEPDVQALLFRAAQEAIRNIDKHARAQRALVRVAVEQGTAELVVADDGRGFTDEMLERRRKDGHVGLRLVADLVERSGGTLDVQSRPDVGTRFTVRLAMA